MCGPSQEDAVSLPSISQTLNKCLLTWFVSTVGATSFQERPLQTLRKREWESGHISIITHWSHLHDNSPRLHPKP